MRLKTSKTATVCRKTLRNVFRGQIPKQNLLSEKNSFLIKVMQKRPKSFKTCYEMTETAKMHKKLKIG